MAAEFAGYSDLSDLLSFRTAEWWIFPWPRAGQWLSQALKPGAQGRRQMGKNSATSVVDDHATGQCLVGSSQPCFGSRFFRVKRVLNGMPCWIGSASVTDAHGSPVARFGQYALATTGGQPQDKKPSPQLPR
ncbi:hypothetical protein [Erythrobacter sp.]|uniref:hypothetical protein n=1 Tax=Erythrobacter sp. TaxID=1042 RepID=UPI0025E6DCC7|nr:hypothetical protein [Erythrobacter sp.]